MGTDKPEDSGLTDTFQANSSAMIIDASFSGSKVAIGKIFILENNRIEPSKEDKSLSYGLDQEQMDGLLEVAVAATKESFVQEQKNRFADARARTVVTYENYLADAENASIEVRDIALGSLSTELAVIKDPSILKKAHKKIDDGATAEVALDEVYEEQINIFRAMEDPYLRKYMVELDQHRSTMQHHLHPDKTLTTLDNIEEGTLLVSSSLPLHALSSFRDKDTGKMLVNGAIAYDGSLESHGAILITGMGIPYARISKDDMARMKNGDMAIMDGGNGQILLHPNKAVIESYEQRVYAQNYQSATLLENARKTKTVKTLDGVKINIHANFAISDEAHDLKIANPVGIGLYRTEIAASMRENDINALVWKNIIKQNMEASSSNDKGCIGTTVRTIDLSGDKSDLPKSECEVLQASMTKEQMRGLLLLQQELVADGHKSKLKVMVPTVSSVEDMLVMQKMMDDRAEGLGVKSIKLGCMVEVPSVLSELDKLDVSFMSVGSNDLIHDLLGIDRYNSESIKKYDPTNPAVLKALDHVHDVGNERNIPFSICGNMASEPKYTALLIGAGFTNMSAKIDSIPEVKEMASRVDMQDARDLFDRIKETDTRSEREGILQDYNKGLGLGVNGKLDLAWTPSQDGDVPVNDDTRDLD
ncbi:MAG: hypothetical protein COA45_09695 [Zetaproteobacteria bacterium]|nr:MAG: hypothetical protein COA45_09695 [Zetaproteobacteria bacterium]